jgi:UDP-N-acetylglucosamine 4-epimerase
MKILVTGGAGFIGSNLVQALLDHPKVKQVRVLDNFATGSRKNTAPFLSHPSFEMIEGDIRNADVCRDAAGGMDIISHQAALGSVPRSITDPLTSNEVNITGTLNIFNAAREAGISKVVYAASSSTYGDSATLPKVEDKIGRPLSPYAVTKYVNELYADVFTRVYGLRLIGLRYFNVFGPRQNPAGPYAAVIPLFAHAVLKGEDAFINGDGTQSRDFTFVENVVQANINALFSGDEAWNQVYNIACGEQITVLEMFNELKELVGSASAPRFRDPRAGDIKHSLADISKARKLLDYNPIITVRQGLAKALEWYRANPDYFTETQS